MSDRRGGWWGPAGIVIAALVASLSAAPVCALQRADPRLETRMLREASAQEAGGELAEAEATLRELLGRLPGSASAVFALERVLRLDERLGEVLPVFDRFLAERPSANRVWEHKVAVLAEVDSLSAVEPTVRNWIRAAPGSPEPWRGGARALGAVMGAGKATGLIEEGLKVLGELPVLLIDLGEVEFEAGRTAQGARAWARALGSEGARRGEIFRRVEELGDERGAAAARIVAELGAEPVTVTRLEAGAELALREGLEADARNLAEAARARLSEREARSFLNGFAGRAENLGRHESALWAYVQLREMTDTGDEARTIDASLAGAALAAGDTATALAARQRITGSYRAGTSERRAAWIEELDLLVRLPDTGAATEALIAFKAEFPDADDLDVLSAALASKLLDEGKRAEAMEVLSGIEGPGAGLERAFILLEGGALPEAVAVLQAALPELEPAHATEILELTLALSELTPRGAALAAEAAIARHRGSPDQGVAFVRDGIDALPAPDRPTLLALGARTADLAGLTGDAAAFRRRIVAEYPDAREFPEAALRLARAVAAEPGGAEEAARILEDLIVSHPDSPVVPVARRELRRIRPGGGGMGPVALQAGRTGRR